MNTKAKPKNDGWDAWRIARAEEKRVRKGTARLERQKGNV